MRSTVRAFMGILVALIYVLSVLGGIISAITVVGLVVTPFFVATFILGAVLHVLFLIEQHLFDQLQVQREQLLVQKQQTDNLNSQLATQHGISERTMLLVDAFSLDREPK